MQSRHGSRLPCSVTAQGACRQPSSAQTSWWLRHRWGDSVKTRESSRVEQMQGLALDQGHRVPCCIHDQPLQKVKGRAPCAVCVLVLLLLLLTLHVLAAGC